MEPNSPKNLSKFLGQIVKALSFNNETDKTDYETIQTDIVQAAEEALEHHFPSPTTASDSPGCLTRLLVFRSEDAEVRKILFDSMYVTDEGQYLTSRQKDNKFLKDTVVKFAFGEVPLKNPETIRFAKLDQNQYAFAIVFNLPTTTTSTNPSPRRPPPFQHDSSTDSTSSSSGYSSLPILDDQSSSDYGGSLNPSHSLPTTPSHFQSGGGYHRCRNSGKMTLGAVLMFSTLIPPPLLEPLLLPMQAYITQMYHLRTRSKFPTMLKSYYNCLSVDIQNYISLSKQELSNVLDILPLFNLKIFAEFISLLVTNPWSKINVICSPKVVNSALAIFKVCYMIKTFKRRFPPPPPQKTDSSNPDNSDSGYFSCSTLNSTIKSSICDEEELICDSSSSSFVEDQPRNKFYLGEEEDDEQTESKLALSEPMKQKLFPNAPPPKPIISVQEIPLELSSVVTKTDQKDIYYLNSSLRFSPFQTYQLFHAAPNYDYIHTVTNEILEINLDKLMLRSINLKATPAEPSKKAIRELVSKTRSLTKLINDTEKILIFFLVNLVEIK